MKPVLIIQQVQHDTPDYFEDFLITQAIPFETRRMHAGDQPPASISGYAGYCMLGGPMSVNDETTYPFLAQQKALVREAVQLGIPVIGHCLGGQLISSALGGTVSTAAEPEIGWSQVFVDDAPEAREWFGGRAQVELFQWHNETFSIPPGARAIAHSAHCPNQAFIVDGKHIGMQFHCEVKQDKVRYWATHEKPEIDALLDHPGVQSAGYILASLQDRIPHSNTLAHIIYSRWIRALTGLD